MTYLLIGLIVGIFVILCAVFVIGACMRSAQCSQDEAAETADWQYERQAVRGKAKWNARMARRDGE